MLAVKSLWKGKQAPQAYLVRLGRDEARDLKTIFVRRLFAGNLQPTHRPRRAGEHAGRPAGAGFLD